MNKPGLLTSIAIGDAYGAAFEFNNEDYINKYNDLIYRDRTGTSNVNGKYTDDTQMSIALAEMMIHNKSFTHRVIMESFQKTYHRDPHEGYSSRVKKLISQIYPEIALEQVSARPSNGCVMRVLPLCLIKDIEEMKQKVIMQTTCTHPNIDCINATMLLALVGYHAYHKPKMELYLWLGLHMNDDLVTQIFEAYQVGEVKNNVMETVSFVLQNLKDQTSISQVLKNAIKAGGDTDSTAALSMGMWNLHNLPIDLPDNLLDNLENGTYGKDFLIDLDLQLENKYGRHLL